MQIYYYFPLNLQIMKASFSYFTLLRHLGNQVINNYPLISNLIPVNLRRCVRVPYLQLAIALDLRKNLSADIYCIIMQFVVVTNLRSPFQSNDARKSSCAFYSLNLIFSSTVHCIPHCGTNQFHSIIYDRRVKCDLMDAGLTSRKCVRSNMFVIYFTYRLYFIVVVICSRLIDFFHAKLLEL